MAKIFLFPGPSYGLVGNSVIPEKMVLAGQHDVVVGTLLPQGKDLTSFDLFVVNVDPRGVAVRPDYPGVVFLEKHGETIKVAGKPLIATSEGLGFAEPFIKSLKQAGARLCVALAVLERAQNEVPQIYLADDLTYAVAACLDEPARNDLKGPCPRGNVPTV